MTFWEDELSEEVARRSPFVPMKVVRYVTADAESITDRAYVSVLWGCPKLAKNGLCSIYETRPKVCRDFIPGNDPLCVFHQDNAIRRERLPELLGSSME